MNKKSPQHHYDPSASAISRTLPAVRRKAQCFCYEVVLHSTESRLPCFCSSAQRNDRPSQSAAPRKPPRILCTLPLVSSPGAQTGAAPPQRSPKGKGWAASTPAVPAGPGEESSMESIHRSHPTASIYSLSWPTKAHRNVEFQSSLR